MISLMCFCAALLLADSKSIVSKEEHYLSRPVRSSNVNSEDFSSECSSDWNVTTQSFDTTVSWMLNGVSSSYKLHLDYPFQVTVIAFMQVTSETFNHAVTPIVPDGAALYQIEGAGHVTQCCLSLTVPPANPIQSIDVLAYSITVSPHIAINYITIAFPTPDSPTGYASDLFYEIMFGADDMLDNATDIYMLTNITTAGTNEIGMLSVTDEILVMPNVEIIFFQVRSVYNITLSNIDYTITSNWSSSQPIDLSFNEHEGVSSVSTVPITFSSGSSIVTSSDTTSTIIATTSTIIATTVTATTTSIGMTEQSPTSSSSVQTATLIGVGVAVFIGIFILAIIAALGICIFCSLRRKPKHTPDVHSEGLVLEQPQVLLSASKGDKWEIPPQYVDNVRCIGRGGFGKVYEAVIRGYTTSVLDLHIQRNNHNHSVAVKTLKEDANEFDREQFLKEIDLMKTISESSNPHVINMVGSSTLTEPLLLIIEYMQYGDLLGYLKSCRNGNTKGIYSDIEQLQETDIPSFAYQIASGMEYLAHMNLIHRDLACRNVLMGQGRKLKITDFGLSRQVDLESMYIATPKGRFPVRWMAIESIVDRTFTIQSDVWSFGVTLWEMGSLGEVPYSSVGNDELLKHIRSGQRLEKPDSYINDEIYSVMKNCWMVRPADRPTFTQLRQSFDAMLLSGNRQSQYYLEMSPGKETSFVELPEHNDTGTLTRSNMYVKIA